MTVDTNVVTADADEFTDEFIDEFSGAQAETGQGTIASPSFESPSLFMQHKNDNHRAKSPMVLKGDAVAAQRVRQGKENMGGLSKNVRLHSPKKKGGGGAKQKRPPALTKEERWRV